LACYGHLSRCTAFKSNVARRRRTLAFVGSSMTTWRQRPTYVTGATGMLGGALVADLVNEGADVVCLVRDWVPQSELMQSDLINKVRVVRGDTVDERLHRRVLHEYEIDTVFHLAAQTIVGIA